MLFSRTLLLPLLAASAAADGNTVGRAIKKVTAATTSLGTQVSSWRGDLLGALPIVGGAAELLTSLKHGTRTVRESTQLSMDETLAVAGEATTLATAVNGTVRALVDAHPRFQHLFLTPVIHVALGVERDAAKEFGDAFSEKIPKDLEPIAKELLKGLYADLDYAIAEYS